TASGDHPQDTILGPALVIVVVLITVSVGNGLVFSRLSQLDSVSGVLSFLLGAAAAMVALSRDLRADPRVVSTLHMCGSPSCRGSPAHRSEEHTSELQSRENLVCRLLLEKKKAHLIRALATF